MRMILLERVEDLEIWSLIGGRSERFAVKLRPARLRVVSSLVEARDLLGDALRSARLARAH